MARDAPVGDGVERPVSARERSARREHSAGGVVLRRIEGVLHVLVIRDPYRKWGLPKGHLEKDEDAPAAALREVREETGLDELELGPELGTIDWYFRLRGDLVHKYCDFFLMASGAGEPRPEVSEGTSEVAWVPLREAAGRISYGNARTIVRKAVRRVEADDLPEGFVVPEADG